MSLESSPMNLSYSGILMRVWGASLFLFKGVDVPATFEHLLKSEPELATAVAAIKTLILVLEKCSAKTLQELIKLLKEATDQMKREVDCSACSVTSGCELFLRFITLAARLEEEVIFLR